MRAFLIPILVGILCLLSFGAQSAYFLPDTTNVGQLDNFIVEDGSVGSPDNEALWVQTAIGDPTVEWTISQFNVDYEETTTTGIWAFSILDEPDYFIIKNSTRIALFSNNIDLGYGVFAASSLSSAMNIPTDPWQISHVTSLNGSDGGPDTDVNVPEPGLSLLLGIGLIGVGFVRRAK